MIENYRAPLKFPMPNLGKRYSENDGENQNKVRAISNKLLQPPPTPSKNLSDRRGIVVEERLKTFRYSELTSGELNYRGMKFAVEIVEGAAGDFLQAYNVLGNIPLIENYQNEAILIKAFHETRIRESGTKLDGFMRHSLKQYRQCIEMGIPVAKILNDSCDDFQKVIEEKLYIVEKIPHPVNKNSWGSNQTFEQLDPLYQSILIQAKEFINKAFESQIPLDLLPQNCRYDNDGKLYLVDFREIALDELDSVSIELDQAIRVWANGNSHIEDYLTPADMRSS